MVVAEDEFTAPPPIGTCSTHSLYYAYSSVQCGTDQYKLCCDAPTWTAGDSQQHAAVPPKSLGACTTDWSYPCCCDGKQLHAVADLLFFGCLI